MPQLHVNTRHGWSFGDIELDARRAAERFCRVPAFAWLLAVVAHCLLLRLSLSSIGEVLVGRTAAMGIDLIAGGRNKKTARTAPKSDNVYLKLLVKVTADAIRLCWARAHTDCRGGVLLASCHPSLMLGSL